jgi:hypothetical protein
MWPRIFKTYYFPLHQGAMVSFSSSPLFLHSKDDYYTTSNGLIVMETTNSILDKSLYDRLNPQSLFSWHRAMTANYLATSGSQWTQLFQYQPSGTYTNQWMVVNTQLFQSNPQSPTDLLWIAEEIPGLIVSQDVTPILHQRGFWPSYNIPYSTRIYNISGYPQKAAQFGDEFTYSGCSRARIFDRNATLTQSMEDVLHLIRFNDYQHDPLSSGNPLHTIASRADLPSPTTKRVPFGEIDAKITTAKSMSMSQLSTWAIACPTYDQQSPFDWAEYAFDRLNFHQGHPQGPFQFPLVRVDVRV